MDLDWPPFDEGGSSCFDASSLQDSTTSIIASDSRIRGDLGWRLWGNNTAMDWYKGSSGPKFGSDWSFKIQLPHICHLRSPHMPESKKIILEVLWSSVLPKGSPYHVWVMVLSIQGVGSVRPNYLRLDNLLQSTPLLLLIGLWRGILYKYMTIRCLETLKLGQTCLKSSATQELQPWVARSTPVSLYYLVQFIDQLICLSSALFRYLPESTTTRLALNRHWVEKSCFVSVTVLQIFQLKVKTVL